MDISHVQEFLNKPRGANLFVQRWVPGSSPYDEQNVRAIIFICHGYGDHCSTDKAILARKFAQNGFVVFSIDYEGHGQSSGLPAYIPDFNIIVEDCLDYLRFAKQLFPTKKAFCYAESMGGAVCLLMQLTNSNAFDGIILDSPMFTISEKVKPPAWQIPFLKGLATLMPTFCLVPAEDIISKGVKLEEGRQHLRNDTLYFKEKPRLKTATELLRVTEELAVRVGQISNSVLILQGTADEVVEPEGTQRLFEALSSADKKINMYDGMWHSFWLGEPLENQELVFNDMIKWLEQRI
eukprot:TRINITY_DN111_c0_g1_i1.p1 TRINITY_DN111_c0_g1~~TRINITY_DN111_c0_g1_i1.p1  ORF type:complete len:294 (+),score=120.63 TRINITY_DN111_c0_g1_i1:161-1042(+)